jgi:hypothetical protein
MVRKIPSNLIQWQLTAQYDPALIRLSVCTHVPRFSGSSINTLPMELLRIWIIARLIGS